MTFSAMWSHKLGQAIDAVAANRVKDYDMSFPVGSQDYFAINEAINQGIDSHLETILFKHQFKGARLEIQVESKSLRTLVRRLLTSGNENSVDLGSNICQTLGIELV